MTPDEALDVDTWRALLADDALDAAVPEVEPPSAQMLADLRREGYLHQPAVLPRAVVTPLADAARRLAEAGFPPVYLWIHDSPWRLLQAFGPFLGSILGSDYRVLPEIWTWFVPPTDEAAGWRPHRDQRQPLVDADGSPHSLTLWLPLTDATVLNGCMYLLPMHVDPDLRRPGVHLTVSEPQNIRALPADAGSVLLWNQNVLHWGSRSSRRASGPRVSLGCQFQRRRPPVLGRPVLPPGTLPPFELRLFLIARAILGYGNMTPIATEHRELAQAVKERLYERIANAG